MSEEQNTKKENYILDDRNEEQPENSEVDHEAPILETNQNDQPSNDFSIDLNEEFPQYVEDEIEVQTSDVLMIEELPAEFSSNEYSKDEKIEHCISYEFPINTHKENCSHLPPVHYDKIDNLNGHNKSEIPIYEIDSKQYLKYFDPCSDEFADIEDNFKESSSESESFGEKQEQKPLQGLFCSNKPKENECGSPKESKTFKMSPATNSSNSGDKSTDKSYQPSCSYIVQNSPKRIKETPYDKSLNEGKKKFKISVPTIEEVPELESKASTSSQPLNSISNSRKMKAKVVKRKDKCNVCNARLGLCAIRCRCGGYYCAKHRYDKEHDCQFDYKKMGAEEIRKNNPKIIAEKVRKL